VVDNQICYNQKEAYNLYEVFHVRYSLFKRVYTHKVGKAVEFMITDALLAADSVLGISSAVKDMKRYLLLDDTILNEIEKSKGIL
jgi:HD superfamily phosphohydrolase